MSLSALTAQRLAELASSFNRRLYLPGSIIIRQGDPADKFYIITRGHVEVVQHRPGAEDMLIGAMGSDEYF